MKLHAITKDEALRLYENNATALASALGISQQAVSDWPADRPIPDARQWQLRALHPSVFGLKIDPAAALAPDFDRLDMDRRSDANAGA